MRRAVVERDDAAWEVLHTTYAPQVGPPGAGGAGCREEELDDLCAVAWEKFWRAFGPERLERAAGIAAVLQYLMLCATSVVLDARRKQGVAARIAVALEPEQAELLAPPRPIAEEPDWDEFHALLLRCLRSEAERALIRLVFACGYKPGEIPSVRPDLFPGVEDVYRTRHAIFDRLRRNAALRGWLQARGLHARKRAPAG